MYSASKENIVDVEEGRTFNPIRVIVECNTVEQARLLYHVLNRKDLLEVLKNEELSYYPWESFAGNVDDSFKQDGTTVRNLIENQGYRL